MARKANDLYIISVTKTEKLLLSIHQNPHDFKHLNSIEKHLKSQNLFSHMEIPEESIIPMSLNTMKNIADAYIDGGWEQLNSLRKTVLELIVRENARKVTPNKTTKAGLRLSLKIAENKLLKAHKANLVLLDIITELIQDFEDIAETSSNQDIRLFPMEVRAKVLKILTTLNSPPYNIL